MDQASGLLPMSVAECIADPTASGAVSSMRHGCLHSPPLPDKPQPDASLSGLQGCNVAQVNPVVEGALIGGGVAVAVAFFGYLTVVRTTRMSLNAARDDRRWDKKATAYLDVFAYLSDRRAKRQAYLRPGTLTREDEESLSEYFASYTAPRWFDVSAALLAFADSKVLDALRAANTAHSEARRAYGQWKKDHELQKRHDEIEGMPGREAEAVFVMEALATFRVRMSEADAKEDILMDLMRADLSKSPVNDERGAAARQSCLLLRSHITTATTGDGASPAASDRVTK